MLIGIVGAGGIGGLYGAVLARAGHDVRFLARGANLQAIQQHGLRVQSADFGTFAIKARASADPADLRECELVLFAVKTYDLDDAARAAREMLAPHGVLLTMQNGLDAPDRVAEIVGEEHVLIGTTGLETTILEPGVIGHLSPGHWVTVSAFEGPPNAAVELTEEVLRDAGISASVVEDGRQALWSKALFLSPFAAITSVCQTSIGPIRDLPETAALAETLIGEASRIGQAAGVDVREATDVALNRLRSVAPSMKASMARDFERSRRTEVEALVGALVRMADRFGVEAPATRTIYAVLKLRAAQNGIGDSASER